jgi:uncharacterized membrane protein YedE/YeeE
VSATRADRGLAFDLVVVVGGLLFGAGLAVSEMAKPEVVLSFLQFEDFGLVFVMFGGSIVAGVSFWLLSESGARAPLTGRDYVRRLKGFDRNVLAGGVIFGVGWGLSGICPGAAYASVGIGNVTILWAIAAMFLGSYAQAYWRSWNADDSATPSTAD